VAVVGFAPYGWAAPLNDAGAVRELVAEARAAAGIVIAVFHGGAEGADAQHVPAGREMAFGEDRGDLRAFARTALAAGAGYAEPDPERRALGLVARLSAEDFGRTAARVEADGRIRPGR
jgi:putative intracellular protease/amidase